MTSHRLWLFSPTNKDFNFEIFMDQIQDHDIHVSLQNKVSNCKSRGWFSKFQYKMEFKMKTGEVYSIKKNSREDISQFALCFGQIYSSLGWKNKEIIARGGYQTNLRRKIENDKKVVDEQFNKIGNSFVSLDAFLANLESLEGVFETVRASLKRGDNFGDVKKVSEADKILEDLGCVEVITKHESGNNYYIALAR